MNPKKPGGYIDTPSSKRQRKSYLSIKDYPIEGAPRNRSRAKFDTASGYWKNMIDEGGKNSIFSVKTQYRSVSHRHIPPTESGRLRSIPPIFGSRTESLKTYHNMGDFITNVGQKDDPKDESSTYNISTKRRAQQAKSHPALIAGGGDEWARNTMRVLKGSAYTKGLIGDEAQRANAVEFGHEIGISEIARGGRAALVNAMSSLYLAKHGHFSGDAFVDPKIGFTGSGSGGAKRLRSLANRPLANALDTHMGALKTHYHGKEEKHKRDKYSNFGEWIDYKVHRWTRKYEAPKIRPSSLRRRRRKYTPGF